MLSSSSSSVLTGATSRRATKMVPKTLNALAGRRTVAAARTRTTTAKTTTSTPTCNANNGRLQSSLQQQKRRHQQQHYYHQQQQQQQVQQQSSLAAVYAVPASIESTAGTAAAVGKRTTVPPKRASKRASIATAINSAINPSTATSSTAASSTTAAAAAAAVCRRNPNKQCHKTTTLSWDQARSLFLSAAVPMVGFGFMDQFIMVSAGSYIDNTLGVQLGLATMSAAACGQVISDSCGVLMGGTLERLLLIAPAKLSTAQQALPAVRRIKLLGGVLGVIAGCIIGAIPLILSSSREEEEEHHRQRHEGYEKQQRIGSFLNNVMASPDERWSQHAARCTLHVRRNGEKQVWPSSSASSFATGAATVVIAASSLRGESSDSTTDPVQQCMDSADAFIVYDRKLYVPVVSSNSNNNNSQEVIAVLQIESSSSNGHDFYSPADIDDAKQLARHIGYQL
eukprot:CAMPEP_0113490234 /NCGR_PEP_ID=MMETSP0014_2-20120614/26940_1 /TAXON_ID=2857 /ORGANISM="Nitzschia sp." /LENGTH=453 /DNA_ID=CAMNT_0000383997 /DNA_START=50 /DNA_END=1411 /DNA_ORIENTATION=+ /assembly_acc=CAM_ASM_000159